MYELGEEDDEDYKDNLSEPPFKKGDRVYVMPLKMEATVIRQFIVYDGSESFYGNLELLYDDGVKGISNSWQCEKI